MDMPKLGAEHARLLALAGEWEGTEEVATTPWGPGGPAFGAMVFRSDLDGFSLIQDYVQRKGDRTSFRGHGVFMIDPESQDVLWYWFDSMGFPPGPPARGSFQGQALTLTRVTERGASRYVYEIADNELAFSIENRFPQDPDFKPFVRARYAKKT
jgi:hypothetical protein